MFYYIIPFLLYIFLTIPIGPTQLHGPELFPHAQVDAAVSSSIHAPMLRYPGRQVKPLLRKGAVFKCGKMFPIVHRSLFVYFAFVISQFRFRKLIINYYLIISQNIIHKLRSNNIRRLYLFYLFCYKFIELFFGNHWPMVRRHGCFI